MSVDFSFDDFSNPIDKSSRVVIPPVATEVPNMELAMAETIYGLWVSENGKLPEYADLLRYWPSEWPEQEIVDVLSSRSFYLRMSRRGVPWPENWTPQFHNITTLYSRLTPQQVAAMQVVTDPTDKRPLAAKLKQVGINNAVWRAWLRNPVFSDAVRRTSEHLLQDTIAIAHTRLAQKVDQGDIAAIKTLYEVSGRHDPNKQQMLDFAKVMGLVLEVMQRHVTDPAVMRAIGNDLDIIISGETIQPVEQMPMNITNAELPAGGTLDFDL